MTFLQRGIELRDLQRFEEARACFEQAIAVDREFAQAYYQLGYICSLQCKFDEAVAFQQKALAIDPLFSEAHNNLGYSHYALKNFAAAILSYRQAIACNPAYVKAYYNLALVFQETRSYPEALTFFQKAADLDPLFAEAHLSAGNIYHLFMKRSSLALPFYRKAIAARPDYAEGYFALGDALYLLGRPDEAMDCFKAAIAIRPGFSGAYDNYILMLQYRTGTTVADVQSAVRGYAAQFEAPHVAEWPRHRNPRDPGRRLKIGYVSPDFHGHAIAHFIAPVIAHHDKQLFETYCYYNNVRHHPFTDQIRAGSDHWLQCHQMSDTQLAERIGADGIDILVDLASHTGDNRLLTFARKPAPIQVSWLGYPGTTGLRSMDYRLTDSHLDPLGLTEGYYSETLLRLPNCAIFQPVAESPPVNPLPALTAGVFTFACLNNLAKVSEDAIRLWSRIMAALPQSRLILGNVPDPDSRQRLVDAFARHGIEANRVATCPRMPLDDYLALHHWIDLALDPFPYNGVTTTCHSLWMGVPVITWAGQTPASRQGAAVLGWSGLAEFIAASAEEYVERALELANDLPKLALIREGLRARVASGPGTDPVRLTRNLESAFRAIWRKWCEDVS